MLAGFRLHHRLSDWAVLLVALPLCGGFAARGLADPAGLAHWTGSVTGVAFRALDWLYMLLVPTVFSILWFAVSAASASTRK